jgi:protein farnesyltransferase/geranylgeranyltransferase type-1 subunit alpha
MPDDTTGQILYAERPEWSDVVPIPQYENVQPLAPIFYSPDCMQRSRYLPSRCTD